MGTNAHSREFIRLLEAQRRLTRDLNEVQSLATTISDKNGELDTQEVRNAISNAVRSHAHYLSSDYDRKMKKMLWEANGMKSKTLLWGTEDNQAGSSGLIANVSLMVLVGGFGYLIRKKLLPPAEDLRAKRF